ncbi:hypothetical protein F4824DRAFT_3758 [Ustulina deusta]|nr:hypothetical protein F4823DRAFT_123274 [Ustulina deusta]KAI3343287.1 hypothetical protein F4824DRAFT_3758 [Ustulina deusta]
MPTSLCHPLRGYFLVYSIHWILHWTSWVVCGCGKPLSTIARRVGTLFIFHYMPLAPFILSLE